MADNYCPNCGKQHEPGRDARFCPACGRKQPEFAAPGGVISNYWYVVHSFLGIISGLVVWAAYRNQDRNLAYTHLVISLLITLIAIPFGIATLALEEALFGPYY